MRLATQYDRIHAAGAECIAISVDDEFHQAAMSMRWGQPATRFVSDPGGERFLKSLELFDPQERGGIALPALLAIDQQGVERFRYTGRDFADRAQDEDVLVALEKLCLSPIDPPDWSAALASIDMPDVLTGERVFPTDHYMPYFRGGAYTALAIEWRLNTPEGQAVAAEYRAMTRSMIDAGKQWRSRFT